MNVLHRGMWLGSSEPFDVLSRKNRTHIDFRTHLLQYRKIGSFTIRSRPGVDIRICFFNFNHFLVDVRSTVHVPIQPDGIV